MAEQPAVAADTAAPRPEVSPEAPNELIPADENVSIKMSHLIGCGCEIIS